MKITIFNVDQYREILKKFHNELQSGITYLIFSESFETDMLTEAERHFLYSNKNIFNNEVVIAKLAQGKNTELTILYRQ